MKNKYSKWMVFGLFLFLSFLFFFKGFTGYSIQGTDGTLGFVKGIAEQAKYNANMWSEESWLGMKTSTPLSLYIFILKIFGAEMAETLTFFAAVLLSLIFSFLFLKKNKLSDMASVFGAAAYSFTPPFLSLIYSGHILVIDMMPYPPVIFYFLSVMFDREEKKPAIYLSVILAGVAWGIMMSDDIQRGIYISIIAAFFILFKIAQNHEINFKNLFERLKEKKVLLDFGKIVFIGILLFLSFFNGLNGWLGALKGREAQTQNLQSVEEASETKWKLSTMWSFHPAELIDGFAFGYHGKITGEPEAPYWGYKEFCGNSEAMGFFVMFFALLGIFAFYKRSGIARFFFWTGAAALLLSFGRFLPGTPFYWLFYNLPLMKNFRAPAKFVSIAVFAFSILAAFGFEFLFNIPKGDEKRHEKIVLNTLKVTGIFLGIEVIWLFFITIASPGLSYSIGQRIQNQAFGSIAVNNIVLALLRMIIFTIFTLGLLFASLKLREKPMAAKIFAGLFILLSIFDLWSINWYYLNKSYIKPKESYNQDGVVSFLTSEYKKETFRVGTSLMFPANGQAMSYPVTSLKGYYLTYIFPYYGIQPMDITATSSVIPEYNNFFLRPIGGAIVKPIQTLSDLLDINIRLLSLANVKYLIIDGPAGDTNILLTNILKGYDGKDHYIFYIPGYLPRLGFYENYIAVKNNDDALRYISDRTIDINNLVVINALTNEKLVSSNKVMPLKIDGYKEWDIKSSIDTQVDGMVLLTTKYEPEWKAYVDGKSVSVYQANYLEMGIFVSKGSHSIEFKYEPDNKPLFLSLGAIFLGLIALAAFLLYSLLGKKKIETEKL